MSNINFSRTDLIKKVKEAQELLKKAKKQREVLENKWKEAQLEKKDTLEKAKALAVITERITKEEPKMQEEMTNLVFQTNKLEGFLENIASLIEGSLEDLVKELN